ncbi:hypothetical protein [Alloalcanivorax xenomutans]|uniref:hypothetical protein n=1 Tax=Alloalcanivorax xenomutans TaxID=1094342 RepID=UPI003C6333D3
MKVYGFDWSGPSRGDLMAAQVDAVDLEFGMDAIAANLDWEFASRSFKEAKETLLKAMTESGADPELIQAARRYKASYVPEV